MIDKFVEDVCKILKIEKPSVSFDTSNFASETMLAQCSPDGSTIFLKKYKSPNPDQLFAIAHELRHVWQMQNDEEILKDYKPIELCNSLNGYNFQLAELDANAFGSLIMEKFFALKPQFYGLSKEVKNEIAKRKRKIRI